LALPFQPIPEKTQVHVDRLVGATLGEFEVGARVSEGRFGTIYRATQRASGKQVTLEVLRTDLVGDDQEVKAANAIKCSGIANVFDFGQVPDGRRYRVMELLEGESLDQRLQRGRLSPPETARILGQIAEVLQAAHAWGLPHGSLGTSSVFLVGGAVKLIDFGLARQKPSIEGDLQQLGALGFTLLTGEELADRAPPPLGSGTPDSIDRLLRELLEKRLDATETRKELSLVLTLLETPQFPASRPAAPRRHRAFILAALAIVLAGGGLTAFLFWPGAPEPEPEGALFLEEDEGLLDEAAELDSDDAGLSEAAQTGPRPPRPSGPRRARPVPSARALMEEISRLDSRFHKQVRPGDDIDQAMYVLNKQRLRLTGEVTEKDRKDVARQLAGWRRSYLRK
jgi:hypothetical protein